MNEKLEVKEDPRGRFVEIFKLPGLGQISYSTTKPGITRGNHYHTRKQEKFCLIEGQAKICLRNRQTQETKEYLVSGDEPEIIEMIVGWTHNIKNVGEAEMKLLIFTNEIFDPQDPDTFAEEV
ncbi:MAG: hypothetical protein AAB740_05265 [Patescibacteria group bacterium]